jgi:hypothetical protein
LWSDNGGGGFEGIEKDYMISYSVNLGYEQLQFLFNFVIFDLGT